MGTYYPQVAVGVSTNLPYEHPLFKMGMRFFDMINYYAGSGSTVEERIELHNKIRDYDGEV